MIFKHKSLKTSYLTKLLFILVICCIQQIQIGNSLRISRKCQYGHYYNDGCVTCWCEKNTGYSVCENMTSCPRNAVKCPMGQKYRDECDNECSCYETTGAIFCKEKGQCNSIRRRQTFDSIAEASSMEPEFAVPDPMPLPKDDLIIEPALIIRRKSFNNAKGPKIYDNILSSSQQFAVHTSSRNRKPHNTLLYLYEKQLKSMNEFRNYYKHYLRNEHKHETKDMQTGASSDHYSTVRKPKPFINLSINIPKKYPPIGSVVKRPHVPQNQRQDQIPHQNPLQNQNRHQNPNQRENSNQNEHQNSHQNQNQHHIQHQKYHNHPRPPPSSTIVYERRYTIPVTIRPPLSYQSTPQRPKSNPFLVTPSESSIIPVEVKPRPTYNPFTNRPPLQSSTNIQKGIEEYAGDDYPSDLKDLSIIPQKTHEGSSYPQSQTRRPFTPQNHVVAQKASASEAVSFYTTKRPVIYSSSTGIPMLHSSTFAPSYYSPTATPASILRPSPMPRRPLVSVTPKSMTYRPISHSSTTVRPIVYQSVSKFAPQYYSSTSRPRQYPTTRRPMAAVTQKPHHPPFHNTQRPMVYSSSTNRPIAYQKSELAYAQDLYSKTYRPRPNNNPTTRRPSVPMTYRPTQAPYRTTNRPIVYSSSTIRPIAYPSASTYAPSYHSTTTSRPRPRPNPVASASGYDFRPSVAPFPPYDGPFVHDEINKPIRINHLLKGNMGHPQRKYIQRPKQYQILLKSEQRKPYYYADNNRVPLFVDKIARQFFRKPEIFIPKIKNGQPGLERVVFNHKEMIPSELILEPGGSPMKIKFSPEAEEQMAKEWNDSGKPPFPTSEIIDQGYLGFNQDLNENHVNPHSDPNLAPSLEYETGQPEYQLPSSDYENPTKSFQVPEYEAPILEPDSTKSDYYDAPHPSTDYDTPHPSPNYDNHHSNDQAPSPPTYVMNHHYQIPPVNSDYHHYSKSPDNHYSPSEQFEYVSPKNPIVQPAFEIPTDQMDNFNHHDHNEKTIVFDSIKKSHEVTQQTLGQKSIVNLEPQYIQEVFQDRVGQSNSDQSVTAPIIPPPKSIFASYTGTSAEINHDELIRSVLSMDPEIGPDAIIYKSNGQTIPPSNPVTVRTTLNATTEIPAESQTSKESLKVESLGFQVLPSKIPQLNLRADTGIISFDYNYNQQQNAEASTEEPMTEGSTTESPFNQYFRELFTIKDETTQNKRNINKKKPDATVDTEGVAKIFSYELQKSQQVFHASTLSDTRDKRNDGKVDNKTLTSQLKSITMPNSSSSNSSDINNSSVTIESQGTTIRTTADTSTTIKEPPEDDPSSSFKKELDWKSDLMSNICDVNPNSSLCYTYKSLCLLMSS